MPFKDPDPTDPNMLVGVMLPADAEATRDMAYVFAEEFARMGYGREQLLWLFKNPFYGGAHGAYQALGETEILAIIDECVNVWGRHSGYRSRRSNSSNRSNPLLGPPPRRGGGRRIRGFKRLEPTKRIERSAAIEPLERS